MHHSQQESDILCPYCGESFAVLIDASAGSQQYYEDCSVCCAPIFFSINIDSEDNILAIDVKRDDD